MRKTGLGLIAKVGMAGALAVGGAGCVPDPSLVDTANRQATGAILGGIFNPYDRGENKEGGKAPERWEKIPWDSMACLNYQGFFIVDGGNCCRVYKPIWGPNGGKVVDFQPMNNVMEVKYDSDSPSQSRIIFR